MKKVELLLPAGNEECLRAAVNNGADAVYLGLKKFSARNFAGNFDEKTIFSAVDYCHRRNVKVYVTLNTLIKNSEIKSYFELINTAYSANADAVIIQDPCFIPIIKKNFPDLKIHLSTQATTTNSYSIPEGADRIILARELAYNEVKSISQKYETEIFVHGALCFSYSGQCLFSSIAGGRSGNRGQCAQPCRMIYNNKYLLSTMDLCMLPKISEIVEAGVCSLKIEGRMRNALYVQTAAKIYRKAIDSYYAGKLSYSEKDIADLKLVFNREFTTGFAFNESILDTRKPMNRGLFIGVVKDGKINLREELKVGDGVGIWMGEEVAGHYISKIIKDGKSIQEAFKGDVVEIDTKGAKDGSAVFKTSSADMKLNLGDELIETRPVINKVKISLPKFEKKENNDPIRIFVKVYNKSFAVEADKAKADIIYYDIMKEDCAEVKKLIKNSKFFVSTPRILSDKEINEIADKINSIKPDGVLVGNRGLLPFVKDYQIHLDYSFNCFNDIDLNFYKATPIISPELNFEETSSLLNKRFIVLAHGDIVLMNTKQKLAAPELIDEEGRHFKVRKEGNIYQILNFKQIGLFNKALDYKNAGIKYYFIDISKDVNKFVRVYRNILSGKKFDDTKIKKGYTTGHFSRGAE